jgi:beta-lactamase class A
MYFFHPAAPDAPCKEIRFGNYKFINPLLECRGDDVNKELKPFKNQVQDLIDGIKTKNDASSISVYFRDMNNGPWFGINEDEKFIPASLLKVPVMIAYLKKAETDPGVMQQTITYDTPLTNDFQYVVPDQEVQLGEKHTVEDLIYRSIVFSDNIAITLLTQNSEKFGISLQNVYNDFGIDYKLDTNDNMTVKSYAAFFRILFNASYLNRDMSETALGLLTQTKFKNGIAAGVPSDIKVANKFGEKPFAGPNKQLHDCGIVYYPQHPYLLCIMSSGADFQTLENNIRDISALIYKEVDGQYHAHKTN